MEAIINFLEKYSKYVLLKKEELDKVERWFNHRGELTVFITRLLPGIRTFISLPAGMAKMNLTKFSIYTILGVIPWCFLLAYLGYIFGENWKIILNYYHRFEYIFFAIIILMIVAFLVFMFIKKTTFKMKKQKKEILNLQNKILKNNYNQIKNLLYYSLQFRLIKKI